MVNRFGGVKRISPFANLCRRRYCCLVSSAGASAGDRKPVLGKNAEMAEKIASTLRDSGKLHGYTIGIRFDDGTLWIKGQVSSQEQKDLALKMAAETPGVTRVVNSLSVVKATPAVEPKLTIPGPIHFSSPEEAISALKREFAADRDRATKRQTDFAVLGGSQGEHG